MTFDFKIPKIFKTISLGEYAPEFGEAHLEVWVNVPKALILERDSILTTFHAAEEELKTALGELTAAKEEDQAAIQKRVEALKEHIVELNQEMKDWYGKIWRQNGSALSRDEVDSLFKQAEETDPQFMPWLIGKTFDAINDHREARKN